MVWYHPISLRISGTIEYLFVIRGTYLRGLNVVVLILNNSTLQGSKWTEKVVHVGMHCNPFLHYVESLDVTLKPVPSLAPHGHHAKSITSLLRTRLKCSYN